MYDRQGKKTLATEARHYVYKQTRIKSADGEGGFTDSWSAGDMLAAAICPIQARQQNDYKSTGVDATHLIKIRGVIAIDEQNDRFLFGSRIFEILTVEDIEERGIVKVITCKEVR